MTDIPDLMKRLRTAAQLTRNVPHSEGRAALLDGTADALEAEWARGMEEAARECDAIAGVQAIEWDADVVRGIARHIRAKIAERRT